MVYRKRDGVEGGLAFQRIEEYAWNAFNLLEQFTVRTDAVAEGGGPGCEPDATTMPADVWRYRFNPMQEREQKRQEITSGNVVRDGLAWTYTLLGADTKQLATYNGIEGTFCGQEAVWMWPVEYNSYGPANTRVILRPNGTKEYVIADHLGSPRITVNDQGAILQHTTYAPFGSVLTTTGTGQRTGYIGLEADNETGLGNYGVRLYEPEYGRFMSVDVLWGEYEGWQPYQYGLNSPTVFTDRSGKVVIIESGNGSTTYRFDGTNLLDTKGNVYEGTDEFLQSTLRVLMDLTALGGDAASDIRTLMQSDHVTTIGVARSGENSGVKPDIEEGPAYGIYLSTYERVGTDARLTIHTNDYGRSNNEKLALFGHEIRHAFHQVTGTREYDSERQGLMGENTVRSILGMPMRLDYGGVPYNWQDVVPWWVPRQ
ncbi:MAG: hypothetical protein UZ22_OP11002001050 [Microgenomates bacterium OLB23]|nr:MAG: hypothetical protein UZ22_OP11002001050 [Microgenomates bacterium OLB23]